MNQSSLSLGFELLIEPEPDPFDSQSNFRKLLALLSSANLEKVLTVPLMLDSLFRIGEALSGMGPVPVQPGSVSTGINPMRRGPASLEGPLSLLSQRPKQSLQGLYRD